VAAQPGHDLLTKESGGPGDDYRTHGPTMPI
jgi:hypothetical protein